MADRRWSQIDSKTWRFDEGPVRFFLLVGDDRALLVDCGMATFDALEQAADITSLPISLCLTHADRDHVASLDEFDQVYVSASELVHPELKGLPSTKVVALWDGEVIDLGQRELEVIALPGHTPGSVALLDRASRALFSGDPIQVDGRIFMFGPMRSMTGYILSLERLSTRVDDFDSIWPCHATCPIPPSTIVKLLDGARRVEAGQVGYAITEMHGTPVREYDVGVSTFLMEA